MTILNIQIKFFKNKNFLNTILVFTLLCGTNQLPAQHIATVANTHSHNDYEQKEPFWLAYRNGFGSIEADVFLVNNDLPVAHEAGKILPAHNLKMLYLQPLTECIKKNNGFAYANHSKTLQVLIDCKTDGVNTLNEIIRELKQYPDLINNPTIRFVITGNQPDKDSLFIYPPFIWFDGDLNYQYTLQNLNRIALFSADFQSYSKWDGVGELDRNSAFILEKEIKKAHAQKKGIRFWGAPDNENAWTVFIKLGIDYINTDKIEILSKFLADKHSSKEHF